MSGATKRQALAALLALLACGCDFIAPRGAPPPAAAGPPPIQLVAAVDEAGGRYIQVTLSRADIPFDVKSALLTLPGRPPVAASEIRRATGLGDITVARPQVGVDMSGGSRSAVSTGVGVVLPIARQGTIQQMIVILPIADLRAYRSQIASATIVIVVRERDGREHTLSAAAPPPR